VKVLFVCSGTTSHVAPFIKDQQTLLIDKGLEVDLFTIENKGYVGYFKSILKLRKYIKKHHYDVIHAHYGLSGLVATFQKKLPVVVTYHGSDIHQAKIYKFSKLTIKRADQNIFVSEKLRKIAGNPKNSYVIPCGVDFNIFNKKKRSILREKLSLSLHKKYVLFSSDFQRAIKNPQLALDAVAMIDNVEIIELKGYSRNEVADFINAVDICLLTSQDEGSPQFIKESAACGQNIVTTKVGDIDEILKDYPRVIYVNANIESIRAGIIQSINENKNSESNDFNLSKYDNDLVASRLKNIYKQALI